jgi:hypothetical protein
VPILSEYRLQINGVTPETLPLLRLADYLKSLTDILGGNSDKLHLVRMEKSSAVPVIGIESQEAIKTERRILGLKTGAGSANARRGFDQLNAALAEHGYSAVLKGPAGKLIEFPGKKQPKQEPSAGPVTDEAIVDGEVVQISGRDETISVYIRRERQEQICTGSRAQGKDLAKFLFSDVRIFGIGQWTRNPEGKWELEDVKIKDFAPLCKEKLSDTIERLHSIKSEAVAAIPDPMKFIADLRN